MQQHELQLTATKCLLVVRYEYPTVAARVPFLRDPADEKSASVGVGILHRAGRYLDSRYTRFHPRVAEIVGVWKNV